ncbi:MAG: hypothetical protein D6800_02600 [Candidatus Zixiibacteriota bacterium]|nr:MAG: hypothetical protein D6800_02600 [candidate division Zixibacteria bacterium]
MGLKFGGGFEYFATPQISIFTEGNYHFVFTSDDTAFGTDLPNWDDDGFLDVKAGLSYWFPIGGGE